MWLAMVTRRSREVPAGTVGGRMAWAKTPLRSAWCESAVAWCGSPVMMGMMGMSVVVTRESAGGEQAAEGAGVGAEAVDDLGGVAEDGEGGVRGGDRGRGQRG